MKLRRLWVSTAALLLVSTSGLAARAATLDVVDGELVGAFDVVVSGKPYDVSFQDGTCADLFDGCDEVSDFVFQSSSTANAASFALLAQVLVGLYDDDPELTAGCEDLNVCRVSTPYAPIAPNGGVNTYLVSAAENEAAPSSDGLQFISIEEGTDLTETPKFVFAVWTPVPECSNGIDDDGDQDVDYPDDLDCRSPEDVSEEPDCDDLVDNDLDGYVDYPDDPGCASLGAQQERTACQDGLDNDSDGRKDFDGGQSIHGACSGGVCPPGVSDIDSDGVADPDTYCDVATRDREKPSSGSGGCGVGPELALLLPGLWRLRRASGRRSRTRDHPEHRAAARVVVQRVQSPSGQE